MTGEREIRAETDAALRRAAETGQMAGFGGAEHEIRVKTEVALLRARREAQRIVDAEESPERDLDELYLDRAALEHLPQPDPLIPGVLPRHAYGVLRGRDQSYKSFVALDWALTLSTGRLWNLTPVERVPVLYIAGEGAWGLRQRLAAWEQHTGTPVEPKWFTVRQAALNLHRPGPAFDHLLEHVSDRGYGLVVVDTLRRVSGAADGNGSEMGAVVDSLDRVKHATAGGSVLVVAHTDKADTDSRGYSGIEDDADFVWHARRDANQLELELTKMKDGPDGITLRMQSMLVGESLVLVPSLRTPRDEATESEAKLLAVLRSVFPEGAYNGALLEASGLPKTTYYRARAGLLARREMVNTGSHARPFYVAAGAAGSHAVPSPQMPPDQQKSHAVPPESHEVPLVPRPLGSGTNGTGTAGEGLTDEQQRVIEGILASSKEATP